MFVPKGFKFDNEAEKIAFIRRYSFATIVTSKDNIPLATQLPFVIDDNGGNLVLHSHFNIVNEQAKHIETNTSLVIFSEPHAYISPTHYDKQESVPTWDYIAVHAYGIAKTITDEAAKEKALEQMIQFYDKEYLQQWATLSDKFKKGMMKGIVAFEIEVTALQGQKKLSQNKTASERQRIIQQLEKSNTSTESDLADYIRDTLQS